MFDDIKRELRRLERGMTVAISLPADEEGFLDRQCPGKGCRSDFKVYADDWRDLDSDERAYCPVCRHESPSEKWATPAQVKYVEKVALSKLTRMVNQAFDRGAREFNRRPQNGFLTFSLSYKPGSRPLILPKATAELMEQKFACEKCNCRYSSIGAAFFCPACGHNSALSTFDQTIATVEKAVSCIETVRSAITAVSGRDDAENTVRLILEQSLGRLVGAFERFNEALFVTLPAAPLLKMKRGCFQRLQDGSDLWKEAIGRGFVDMLPAADWRSLLLLYQRRHVITHRDGIVDRDYVQKSGDNTYREGQRLVMQADDVNQLARLVKALGAELRKSCS